MIQSTGAMPANTSAVAFTLPTICTTMAKIAAYFHVPRLSGARSAWMVSASIHGSPAHGRRITEMRDEKSSVYGVSMNSTVATTAPGPRTCSVRSRNSTPSAAPNRIEPSHSRCDTQAGTPARCRTQ